MKDSILTARAKRLALVWTVRLRRAALKALPFILVMWAGVEWGKVIEATRIHNDCKFTNTFRINYTGYTCRIGRE
jgi:hypothetical protein